MSNMLPHNKRIKSNRNKSNKLWKNQLNPTILKNHLRPKSEFLIVIVFYRVNRNKIFKRINLLRILKVSTGIKA
jgi:hypothetical protein